LQVASERQLEIEVKLLIREDVELSSFHAIRTAVRRVRFSGAANKCMLRHALARKGPAVPALAPMRPRFLEFGQASSSRLLLVGPPGSGKTLTASALAGELHLPLFTIRLDSGITRFSATTPALGMHSLCRSLLRKGGGALYGDRQLDWVGRRSGDRDHLRRNPDCPNCHSRPADARL
jgi:hypothetical protein